MKKYLKETIPLFIVYGIFAILSEIAQLDFKQFIIMSVGAIIIGAVSETKGKKENPNG